MRDHGTIPPGVDEPEVYGQRSGGTVLPRSASVFEATAELRKAFVHHTQEEIQASLGRSGGKIEATAG